jgi:hypothetical protein
VQSVVELKATFYTRINLQVAHSNTLKREQRTIYIAFRAAQRAMNGFSEYRPKADLLFEVPSLNRFPWCVEPIFLE